MKEIRIIRIILFNNYFFNHVYNHELQVNFWINYGNYSNFFPNSELLQQ